LIVTRLKYCLAAAFLVAAVHAGATAQTLRIGLATDPDTLDPSTARAFDASPWPERCG
jgi:hypothetical protein